MNNSWTSPSPTVDSLRSSVCTYKLDGHRFRTSSYADALSVIFPTQSSTSSRKRERERERIQFRSTLFVCKCVDVSVSFLLSFLPVFSTLFFFCFLFSFPLNSPDEYCAIPPSLHFPVCVCLLFVFVFFVSSARHSKYKEQSSFI